MGASAQATFPFGPFRGSTTRASGQAGALSISENPTFDIAPSNTKQFYQGLLNPISKNLFSYFVDRGRSSTAQWVFHLLINSIQERDTRTGIVRVIPGRGDDDFVKKIDQWTGARTLLNLPKVIASRSTPTPLGPPVKADAKAIVDANTAGLDIKDVGHGLVQFSKKPTGVLLCFYDDDEGGYVPVDVIENSITKGPSGEKESADSSQLSVTDGNKNPCAGEAPYKSTRRYSLQLKSVEQVFYYLGTLLDPAGGLIRGPKDLHGGCPRIPFFIYAEPVDHTRFSVSYRGNTYYVADTAHSNNCDTTQNAANVPANIGVVDNTIDILAILSDLLNLNRDANEIPTTKAVQTVGGSP